MDYGAWGMKSTVHRSPKQELSHSTHSTHPSKSHSCTIASTAVIRVSTMEIDQWNQQSIFNLISAMSGRTGTFACYFNFTIAQFFVSDSQAMNSSFPNAKIIVMLIKKRRKTTDWTQLLNGASIWNQVLFYLAFNSDAKSLYFSHVEIS